MPERIRSFIAVPIPAALREPLVEVQQGLRSRLRHVHWTRPDAWHLTLAFLGDIATDSLPALSQELGAVTSRTPAFDLELAALGHFDQRVIWVGLGRGANSLAALAEKIRSAAQKFGSHQERKPFSGHVTLGRCRGREPVATALASYRVPPFGSWRVRKIELMRSELLPEGARYSTLCSFDLLGEEAYR